MGAGTRTTPGRSPARACRCTDVFARWTSRRHAARAPGTGGSGRPRRRPGDLPPAGGPRHAVARCGGGRVDTSKDVPGLGFRPRGWSSGRPRWRLGPIGTIDFPVSRPRDHCGQLAVPSAWFAGTPRRTRSFLSDAQAAANRRRKCAPGPAFFRRFTGPYPRRCRARPPAQGSGESSRVRSPGSGRGSPMPSGSGLLGRSGSGLQGPRRHPACRVRRHTPLRAGQTLTDHPRGRRRHPRRADADREARDRVVTSTRPLASPSDRGRRDPVTPEGDAGTMGARRCVLVDEGPIDDLRPVGPLARSVTWRPDADPTRYVPAPGTGFRDRPTTP